MRRFKMHRIEDVSGTSGTGDVAEGVELSCGKVAMTWLSELGVVAVYDNIKVVEKVHGHKGKTIITWIDTHDE